MRFDNIIHILTECTRTLELRHSFYLDLLTADPTILNECSQLNSFTRIYYFLVLICVRLLTMKTYLICF